MCSADCFLAILAILFPPLAVWVKCGLCSADSLINILLCVLGYIPGLLHAWYIIAKFPEGSHNYHGLPQDSESGRVTYVIVHGNGEPRQTQRQQGQQKVQPRPQDQGVMNYGATNNYGSTTQGSSSAAAQAGSSSSAGNNENSPPTYAEAVKGDNKIQTQD